MELRVQVITHRITSLEHGARASQIRSLGYVCVRIPLAPSVVTRDARANVRERREYATRVQFWLTRPARQKCDRIVARLGE